LPKAQVGSAGPRRNRGLAHRCHMSAVAKTTMLSRRAACDPAAPDELNQKTAKGARLSSFVILEFCLPGPLSGKRPDAE